MAKPITISPGTLNTRRMQLAFVSAEKWTILEEFVKQAHHTDERSLPGAIIEAMRQWTEAKKAGKI